MRKAENQFKKQIFVCCNTKKDGTGCGPKGAEDLRLALKEKLHSNPELIGKARVNKSGCMDYCNDGIAVQIQPADKLLLEVKVGDVEVVWGEFI